MSKKIFLGGGYSHLFTVVDNEDYNYLSSFSWAYDGQGYAVTNIDHKLVAMHRMILQVSGYMNKVDHINHNTLDNRKSNIRVVNASQNNTNRKPYSKSGYKGVRKKGERWEASITIHKKSKYLGLFLTPEDAATAYNIEAKKCFGQYAYLNFVGSDA